MPVVATPKLAKLAKWGLSGPLATQVTIGAMALVGPLHGLPTTVNWVNWVNLVNLLITQNSAPPSKGGQVVKKVTFQ